MKYATFTALAFLALCTLTANRAGRASAANVGNTGAPGDVVQPNGMPQTCGSCHNAPNVFVNPTIQVLDGTGNPVQQYVPGQDYVVRLTVNASGPGISRYGFQMIGLRNSDNTDLKGFSGGGSSYKLATVNSTGRVYAEHNNAQESNVFNVAWKAPAAGTGAVTFYAAANAVNNNFGTGGDGAGIVQRTLSEQTVSASEPAASAARLAPTLLSAASPTVVLHWSESGEAQLRVFDAMGRLHAAQKTALNAGANELDTRDWPTGAGYLQVEIAGQRPQILRFLKQ